MATPSHIKASRTKLTKLTKLTKPTSTIRKPISPITCILYVKLIHHSFPIALFLFFTLINIFEIKQDLTKKAVKEPKPIPRATQREKRKRNTTQKFKPSPETPKLVLRSTPFFPAMILLFPSPFFHLFFLGAFIF
ncbi:hypothetical protein LI328DRAFT_112263 [Trichoderma asperelloides]|nr:hypothetical protein LI328DRAFT_112263 [Trichoderma asperelloides]